MFTEQSLRDHPSLVKAFTGLGAEQFWELLEQMREQWPSYLRQCRQHSKRQRAVGAGRNHELSLVVRAALVLTYLRLHIPQATVAALFGATQADVSRVTPLAAAHPAVFALSGALEAGRRSKYPAPRACTRT
jgi:hypothetical protein